MALTAAQEAAGIADANPTTPFDPQVEADLISGQTGLTSAAINALLGFQNDITQEQLAQTQATSAENIDFMNADKAASEVTQYGLEAQQAQDEQTVYGLKVLADQASAQGYA